MERVIRLFVRRSSGLILTRPISTVRRSSGLILARPISTTATLQRGGSTKSDDIRSITLHTGAQMPRVGFGTWLSPAEVVKAAVSTAVDVGYRHVDCAHVYYNQTGVGAALEEKMKGLVSRQELFITSKLWNTHHAAGDVRPACLQTLEELNLDYLDLYLIHWPVAYKKSTVKIPYNDDGSIAISDVHYTETWGAMEELVNDGLVRHIGLSNFNSVQIDEIMSVAKIQPAVLQVECHPYLTQKELIAHAAKYGIVTTAYSPLGSPDRPWGMPDEPSLMDNPKIIEIADKYSKTPAQVLIRFQVDRNVTVIPKSLKPERIKANFDVFDFHLSAEDMKELESLNCNYRAIVPKDEVDGKLLHRDNNHPLYPFHIPY